MERIDIGERKNDERCARGERHITILTRRLFDSIPLHCSTLLVVVCFISAGCSSFGFFDSGHGEFHRGDYAYQDENVEQTWAAASNGALHEEEQRVSVMKPVGPYAVTSGLGENKEPSFSEKMMSVFNPQKTNRSNTTAAHSVNTPGYMRQNPDVPGINSKATYASNGKEEKKSSSFWSKMFPSKKSAPSSASEDKYIVVETRRNAGNLSYSGNSNASNRQIPPRTNGFKVASNALLGKLKPSHSKQYPQRPEIETYDQSRFLPAFADIQKYYYPSGTNASGAGAPIQTHVAATNDVSSNIIVKNDLGKSVSADTSSSRSAYGASYQSNVRRGSNKSKEVLIAEGSKRRDNGSAFISPIMTNDVERQVRRTGNVGNTSMGITRKIESLEEVAQVSYAEQRGERTAVNLSPESLFGWSEETNAVLNSAFLATQPIKTEPIQTTVVNSSDSEFMSSLGKQVDRSWFESHQKQPEVQESVEVEDRTVDNKRLSFVDQATHTLRADNTVEDDGMVETLDEVEESARSNAAPENLQVDPNASLDEIFDAAVASTSNASVDRKDEVLPEDDDSIAKTIEHEEIQQVGDFPTTAAFNEELAQIEEASPLVDAIAQYAEPLAEASSNTLLQEHAEPQESLIKQASEAAESHPTPVSVNERKVAKTAAPLTKEEIVWVEQIKNAIQALLRERESIVARNGDPHTCDARLRLLYVVIGEYDRAIRDIQDDSDPLKVFWEKECRGLETLLHNRLEEIDPTFVADRLLSGVDSLSCLCPLKIRKALLVKEPACYGLYEATQTVYNEGDVVYAYTELDYVTSRETQNGYCIEVECRWRLLDSYGNIVIPFESQRCVNLSETKLRDVVLNVSIPLLDKMASGSYVLELEVVDRNAKEPTTSIKRIDLTVETDDPSAV